jgi:hypothetical protein
LRSLTPLAYRRWLVTTIGSRACIASVAVLAIAACAPRAAEAPRGRTEGAETPVATSDAGAPVPEPEPVTSASLAIEEPPPEAPHDAAPTPAPLRTDLPSIGPTLATPDATDTDVDAAWNSFLTNHARPDCAIDAPLSWLHDRCHAVRPQRVSTSAPDASTLGQAFDLDACTTFTAGDAPQVIELELARTETIDLIVIDPGPQSSGPSRHVIETQDRRGHWVPRTVLFGGYYDTVLYALRFPEPITTRRLRIRTIASPGVVEHREIIPIVCEGEVAIHVEGIAPDPEPVQPVIDWHDPQYTHVAGAGRCRTDRDCAPQSCCGGSMCGLRRTAPDCDGVGCPQSCGSPLDCGHGACICHEGICSLATSFTPESVGVEP